MALLDPNRLFPIEKKTKEIAKKLSISGAKIALSATNVDKLMSLQSDLGNNHLIYPCDLSDLNNINKLSEDVIDDFGTIDILINNAGIKRDDLLIRMKDDDWFDVINMNLTSVYKLTKNITKQMFKQRHGKIISISFDAKNLSKKQNLEILL